MPKGSDDTIARDCILRLVDVVRLIYSADPGTRPDGITKELDEITALAERIDRPRGIRAESVEG